ISRATPIAPRSAAPGLRSAYSGFRLIFFLSLFATTAQQMRQTQNLYQAYELSGSALQLGLTGLAQGIPIFALGLFAGTLADFLDRRKLLLITIFGNCLVAVAQGLLTLSGAIQVWHILVGTAPAVGGVLGTVIVVFSGDIERKGQLALWSFLSYALAVGIFAMCTQMALSLVLLALLGLANSL